MGGQVNVYAMGVDDRVRDSLQLFFRHRAEGMFVLTDEDDADIALVDLDSENAEQLYRGFRDRNPLKPIGAICSNASVRNAELETISKPLSATNLLSLLQKLSGTEINAADSDYGKAAFQLNERVAEKKTSSDRRASLQEDNLYFDPQQYFLGYVLEALTGPKDGREVVQISMGSRVVVLDSRYDSAMSNLSRTQLRAISITPIEDGASKSTWLHRPSIEILPRDIAQERCDASFSKESLESFLWKLAGVTSQGKLPIKMPADEKLFLRRWPNLTRLPYSNNDMRILSYWIRQPSQPKELACALGIPVEEVFRVCASAFAAGLVGECKRKADGLWEAPEVIEHKKRGLFSSILTRLTQGKKVAGNEQEAAA